MAKVWTRIRQTIGRHTSAALLNAVGAAGSVPRERWFRRLYMTAGHHRIDGHLRICR
jgi:hypothetical protein